MVQLLKKKPFWQKEILFQIILHLVVFIFYSFDKKEPKIELSSMVFFVHYAFWALLINYILLPRYLYLKKYLKFTLALILIISFIIITEEFFLEQVFYPGTKRAQNFPGVFYCLIDVLPVLTILIGFKFAWDAFQKQLEVDQLKASVQESELAFLKSQINPHFLFNNLNNLYSYAIEKSSKTPEIILELSGVLRYMLYDCKEKYVPFVKEIKHLENFTHLNQLQIEERGEVNFSTTGSGEGFYIAPLILIVFLENAFKYSTGSQSKEIKIDVNTELDKDGLLTFSCSNSFLKTSNTESLSRGIGLENVKKRLHLLYPHSHKLEIIEEKGIFSVSLELKLKSNVKA